MSIVVHKELTQGSEAWIKARCGILTASQMDLVITPGTLKTANNDKQRAHLYELCAQRIAQHVEPTFMNDDMSRGHDAEIDALAIYEEEYEPIDRVGFVVNDDHGFQLGWSPDALVGPDGCAEVKGPRQKKHLQTLLAGVMPIEHGIQVQTGLLVGGRKWCDFISFCAGLPMFTVRVHADPKMQAAILEAATSFYAAMSNMRAMYDNRISSPDFRLIPTVRTVEVEIS